MQLSVHQNHTHNHIVCADHPPIQLDSGHLLSFPRVDILHALGQPVFEEGYDRPGVNPPGLVKRGVSPSVPRPEVCACLKQSPGHGQVSLGSGDVQSLSE